MESSDTGKNRTSIDAVTIGNLLGELGIEILDLISQGCINGEEIMRLSTITKSCLEVKIPLMEYLALIRVSNNTYTITMLGTDTLLELTGWKR
jgi:hypothetical protein